MSEIELQPDVPDVLQEETQDVQAIAVCIENVTVPVRTQALPRKEATSMNRALGTTLTPQHQLLRADPYRASATMVCAEDVWLAFNSASAQDTSAMARWPASTPFVLTATTELWVLPTNAATVSVVTERWAVGEI